MAGRIVGKFVKTLLDYLKTRSNTFGKDSVCLSGIVGEVDSSVQFRKLTRFSVTSMVPI